MADWAASRYGNTVVVCHVFPADTVECHGFGPLQADDNHPGWGNHRRVGRKGAGQQWLPILLNDIKR